MNNEEMMTFKQAAELLGVRPQTIYSWKNKGRINAIKTKKKKGYLVKKTEIEALKKS